MSRTIDKLKALQGRLAQEKRPRHWADEIVQMKTREERLSALQNVPEDMRGLVQSHVEAAFEKLKFRRRQS